MNSDLIIPGPVGPLEAVMTTLEHAKAIAVVCHPHPLEGGTMNNKVVTTLARTFQKLGMSTLRFNFRGVGNSAGEFAHSEGEVEDCLAVLRWLSHASPQQTVWLAGFSFGAFIAARAAIEWPATQQLILVAPAVNHQDYTRLPTMPCRWLVVQGEQDEVVSAQQVYDWVASIKTNPPTLIKMPDTSHFFHGKLIELREQLLTVLQS